MTSPMSNDTARRVFPQRTAAALTSAVAPPRRFGDELEGPFSANLMRDQFDHLFRQFGR